MSGEGQCGEHLEAIQLEKAKEESPWVHLLPFLPWLRKSDAAGPALLALGGIFLFLHSSDSDSISCAGEAASPPALLPWHQDAAVPALGGSW